ncbi:MAG: cytochrome-c peroxidase [Deltaproteobacteria bacterium]|nr:cytochrome-c peroxidase [Deltaproteobacteria bacterium]
MRTHPSRVIVGALLVVAAACSKDKPAPTPAPPPPATPTPTPAPPAAPTLDLTQARATFKPLPSRFDAPTNPATPEKIALGRMLYLEPRLSKSQTLSCASCHQLDHGGVDNAQFSKGHKGQLGGRNAPTVFNAAGQIAQFWDGRAPDVEEQAKGPVLNPVEMAMPDKDYVITVLASIPGYADAFKAAFPGEADPITYDNFGRAVGAFERGLVTPTRFDEFLAGKDDALAPAEKDGLARFMAAGCTTCHNGVLVGGGMYMKLGMVEPYANTKDQGRFDLTKNEADRMFFKVATLRNVADTAPYFHDGSIAELPEAVRAMGRLQLGKQLSDEDVAAIVTFLKALSGAPPADYIKAPTLPPSGPKTPKPDLT